MRLPAAGNRLITNISVCTHHSPPPRPTGEAGCCAVRTLRCCVGPTLAVPVRAGTQGLLSTSITDGAYQAGELGAS